MAEQTSLDNMKELRLVNDKPIRLLLFTEALSNIGFVYFIFRYPSTFLGLLFRTEQQITPLTIYMLFWWNSWLVVISALMLAAVPSKYNTPTLTAGLVHVRRYLYWCLLGGEIFLAPFLIFNSHRTIISILFGIFCVFVVIGRLVVLFPKQAWFGTVLIEPKENAKQR
jgi:predicted anti-sigma-YlaC factor YlaD